MSYYHLQKLIGNFRVELRVLNEDDFALDEEEKTELEFDKQLDKNAFSCIKSKKIIEKK